MADYDPALVADLVGKSQVLPFHVRESLLVAACLCSRGATLPTEDDLVILAPLIEDALGAGLAHGPLSTAARVLKNLRPYLLRCGGYAEILAPFEDEAEKVLGLSIERTFGAAFALRFGVPKIPPDLQKIWSDISVHYQDVRSHADLWNRAVIEFEDGNAVLVDRMPSAIYEAICKRLDDANPGFYDRKGRSFESLVSKTALGFFEQWTAYQGAYIDGREKDLILLQAPIGVTIESKALRLRPPSTDWNDQKIRKDLKPLALAIEQARESVQALRQGTTLQAGSHAIRVPECSIVRGLVVTDQEYTPYCAIALDELGLVKDDWLPDGIVVLSWFDLQLLFMMADCPALVLDFWIRMRGAATLRRTDEVEAWMAYEMEPLMAFGRFFNNDVNVVLSGTPPWPETPPEWEEFLDKHRVMWIRDWHALVALDRGGKSYEALQLVRADFEAAKRRWWGPAEGV